MATVSTGVGRGRNPRTPAQTEWGAPLLPLAACRGATDHLWHGIESNTPGRRVDEADDLERQKAAKTICAGCCERIMCGTWGVEHPDEVGIWGGMTQAERATIAQQIRGKDDRT